MLVYELCRIHQEWGVDCAVASFAPSLSEFESVVDVLRERGVSLFFPNSQCKKLRRIIHYRNAVYRFRPDVVFGHSELPSLYGRIATKLAAMHLPFISVLHAAKNFQTPLFRMAELSTRRFINKVVTVSEKCEKDYIRIFGKSVPVSVIRNGINLSRFAQVDRTAARQRLGLASDVRIALQIGRIYDVKQQHLALAAMKRLLKAEKAYLWFAGLTEDCAYTKRLHEMITEWGVEHRVRFLGSRTDVPDLLAAADLYLMPSRLESQGIALLEALASGVPIIASDIPAFAFAQGMPSVMMCGVKDVRAWSDAIQEMFSAPRVIRDIGEYSIEHTARAYLDCVRRV